MIRIGKAPDNDAVVSGSYLSRYHAQLSRTPEGTWMLEDCNSTNGTFVNGHQILRRQVRQGDSLMFGGEDCVHSLTAVLHAAGDYSIEFEALKGIYERYVAEKVKIQSVTVFRVRLLQTLPVAALGVAGLLIGMWGKGDFLLSGISLVVMIALPSSGIYLAARLSAKIPGRLQEALTRFRTRYVCPRCGAPLGEQPWEALAARGRCPSCKAIWCSPVQAP
ncbi:MAG: FHA domain-containing protein [Tannerellaceae bacterium]|jgi:DNA-directed RNA polymerase subunit RPC12/RpoP|nr:FHA domain-containing protein [Tannerellaceae bacterium]